MLMFIYVCVLTGVKWGDRWEAGGGGGGDLEEEEGEEEEEEEEGAMFVFLIAFFGCLLLCEDYISIWKIKIHCYLEVVLKFYFLCCDFNLGLCLCVSGSFRFLSFSY